jgi:zinc and cadmium transporter
MTPVYFYTLFSVFLVSLISLVGVVTLSLKISRLRKILSFLVSFAAGALLGGVFIHILPEVSEKEGLALGQSLLILWGILAFFTLEKIVHWRHCHQPTCSQHPHSLGVMNLVGDGLHNFTDGILIAASFMVDDSLGLATTLAVVFHEIPQEIGDFSVLIYAGFTKAKALFFNFLSALLAVLGAVLTLILGSQIKGLTSVLLPLTAGGFLYIATADLIPELKKEESLVKTTIQLVSLLLGIGLMRLIK